MENKQKELQNQSALEALYQSVQSDIVYYRSWGWSITAYYAVLSTGIITLITNDDINYLLHWGHKFCLSIIQTIAIGFSIYHLIKTHRYLINNRLLRNKIENIFGFYEKGKYIPDDTVLPVQFDKDSKKSSFGFHDYIFPFMLFLIIYEVFTIVLIWTL
jgi:hypothetical protein